MTEGSLVKVSRRTEWPGVELAPPGTAIGDYRLFVIAGEHSGDALGGKIMSALNQRLKGRVRYLGVGGEHMEREGLVSQFPLADVAVMGPLSILPRLPRIVSRVYRTVQAVIAAQPDALLIIDSPEFTHPIARRVRRKRPGIPIIDYVCPSVWAWRPGRAGKMRAYVDHVLALLPFEPAELERLGGPPSTYVGHPLIERLDWIRRLDPWFLARRLSLDATRPILVVLPGSRASEVTRLMEPFGETLRRLAVTGPPPQVIVPAAPGVRGLIEAESANWPEAPHIVEGDEDKFGAFKLAHAALAASGTVTLELALCGTPAVAAYRVDRLAARLHFLLKVPSIVLANLVLGENVYPEFIQWRCTAENLAAALNLILWSTPERARMVEQLERLPEVMGLGGPAPSDAAADIVARYMEQGRT